MSDNFTKNKFDCLERIAVDRDLPPLAARLAVILFGYVNRQSRTAWPTQETLANRLGVTVRAIQKTLKAMEQRGYLAVTVFRGRHKPNVYRFEEDTNSSSSFKAEKHEPQFAFSDNENTNNGSRKHEQPFAKTRTGVRTEPIEEPSDEPIEGKHTPRKGDSGSKIRRRRSQTWPDDFHLSDDLAQHAADKAGWNMARAFAEFERFENHHRSKGSVFVDWSAAWRTWVSNGIRFDRERTPPQGGPIIDQQGNPVATPPPWQRQQRQPFRRRSNADTAFDGAQGHEY